MSDEKRCQPSPLSSYPPLPSSPSHNLPTPPPPPKKQPPPNLQTKPKPNQIPSKFSQHFQNPFQTFSKITHGLVNLYLPYLSTPSNKNTCQRSGTKTGATAGAGAGAGVTPSRSSYLKTLKTA